MPLESRCWGSEWWVLPDAKVWDEHTCPFVSGIPVSVILGEPRSQRSESQSVDSGCDEALRGVAAGQR